MPVIHAYRRKRPVDIDVFGDIVAFRPNAAGEMVAEVANERTAARLLEIAEGYRLHESAPAAPPAPPPPPPPTASAFVLTNGEERLDLGAMTDEQVRAFALEQGKDIDGRKRGDKLRAAVIAAFKG